MPRRLDVGDQVGLEVIIQVALDVVVNVALSVVLDIGLQVVAVAEGYSRDLTHLDLLVIYGAPQ